MPSRIIFLLGIMLCSFFFGCQKSDSNEDEPHKDIYKMEIYNGLNHRNDIYAGRDNEQPGKYKINEASNTAQLTAFNGDIFSSFTSVTRLTHGTNGYYYFFIPLKGIYRTKDFVSYELIKKEKGYQVRDFIIANNNNVIIANGDYGNIYYMKQ